MVCKSVSWVHVSSEVWWWVLFGRFHKNLEVSKYPLNALKAPQMVTLGKISCCGGLWVLLALVGWSIKKLEGSKYCLSIKLWGKGTWFGHKQWEICCCREMLGATGPGWLQPPQTSPTHLRDHPATGGRPPPPWAWASPNLVVRVDKLDN